MGSYFKIKIYAYLDKDMSENMEIIMIKQKKNPKTLDLCRKVWISQIQVSKPQTNLSQISP